MFIEAEHQTQNTVMYKEMNNANETNRFEIKITTKQKTCNSKKQINKKQVKQKRYRQKVNKQNKNITKYETYE